LERHLVSFVQSLDAVHGATKHPRPTIEWIRPARYSSSMLF
jgi:hypothetical protein